jgi:hypothetical protein
MENLHINLSEKEFSKGSKALLWSFAALFLIAGIYVLFVNLVLGQKSIPVILSLAPFGISIVVGLIASAATFKGTDNFFLIDKDKIEYKYGLFKPVDHLFYWSDIQELVMPQHQKKVMLVFKDGSLFTINLTWIENEKSASIMKHLFHVAREKDLNVRKVLILAGKK